MAEITNSGLPYGIFQEKRESSDFKGQYYARAKHIKTVSFTEFIKHIASHGSNFTRAEISGVLYKMQDCLLELLAQGYKVEMGDLGTFYMSISSSPAVTLNDFNVSKNITGVHLRFAASRKQINNLSSTELRKNMKFVNIADLVTDSVKDVILDDTDNTPPSDGSEDEEEQLPGGGGTPPQPGTGGGGESGEE